MATPIEHPDGAVETTVFMSGNSQAVRIPAAYRFDTEKVILEVVPGGVMLRPCTGTMADNVDRMNSLKRSWKVEDALLTDFTEDSFEEIDVEGF